MNDDTGPHHTIATRGERELAGRSSILVRQRRDHVRIRELMDRSLATLDHGGVAHSRALRATSRLVFRHAFAEEAVLFPVARRVLPEGDPLTLRIETDHQEVDELVTRLDGSTSGDPGHRDLIERTFAALDHDIRLEEDELLPRLHQLLGPRRLRAVGRRWMLVRAVSPTRAHPTVSRRPPGQALSALPLTVLDRLRDVLQRASERSYRPWHDRADAVLAATAGAVERVPVMRRGDPPPTAR